jgi:hypothetical protein
VSSIPSCSEPTRYSDENCVHGAYQSVTGDVHSVTGFVMVDLYLK